MKHHVRAVDVSIHAITREEQAARQRAVDADANLRRYTVGVGLSQMYEVFLQLGIM